MVKRELVDELLQRKIAMVAALWSNSNYDGEENSAIRQEAIEKMEAQFDQTVDAIYGFAPEDDDVDWDDPFMAPVKRKMEELEQGHDPEDLVSDVLESEDGEQRKPLGFDSDQA